ncbi:MAG: hypothetical protein ABL956_11525 [Hyphomonadaceae bacterium]
MRVVAYGLLAVTAALVSACSAAVGSPEWCTQMQKKMENNPNALEELAKMSPQDQQGLSQCMANAFKNAFGPQ